MNTEAELRRLKTAADDHFRNAQRLANECTKRDQRIAELEAEILRLETSLKDVCNPLGHLKRQADARGCKLSGMAYQIANNISTVQSIARDALGCKHD